MADAPDTDPTKQTDGISKKPFFIALAIALGVTGLIALYGVVGLFVPSLPLNRAQFTAALALGVSLNYIAGILFWKIRDKFSLRAQAAMAQWMGQVSWYWVFGPLYQFLNMILNGEQFRLIALTYLWEVPVFSALFILLTLTLLQPALNAVKTKDHVKLLKLYNYTLSYPRRFAIWAAVFSIGGYSLGGVQGVILADLPATEAIKNAINGSVLAIFIALFYYLFFDYFLGRVRSYIEDEVGQKIINRRFAARVVTLILIITLGVQALVILFVIHSFQNVISSNIQKQLGESVRIVKQYDLINTDPALASESLEIGSRGELLIINDSELGSLNFSEEVLAHVETNPEGVVQDLRDEPNVVAYFTDETTGNKVISRAYLYDFYGPIKSILPYLALEGAAIFIIITVVVIVYSSMFTRALRALSVAVREVYVNNTEFRAQVDTGDEIEQLAEAFGHYIRETRLVTGRLKEAQQKLLETDKMKSEFVALTSHNLRTPLTLIRGNAEMLASPGLSGINKREALRNLRASADKLAQLIEDLAIISSIEAGARLEHRPVRAYEVFQPLLKQAEDMSARTGSTLIADVQINEDVEIKAHADELRTSLINLLENAFKFTRKGQVRIVITSDDKSIKFVVQDNGIGIAPEELPKLFTKFHRATDTMRYDYEGEGIGLYVTKLIIEDHGGKINVQSELGKGTIVTVVLPRAVI